MKPPVKYQKLFKIYIKEIGRINRKIKGFDVKRDKLLKKEVYATEFEVSEIEMQRYRDEMEVDDDELFRQSEFYIDDEDDFEEEEETEESEINISLNEDYGMSEEDVKIAFDILDDDIAYEDVIKEKEYEGENLDEDILNIDVELIEKGYIEQELEEEREYGSDIEIDSYTPESTRPEGSKNVKPVDKIYRFSNGDIYIGKMINNKMHGIGNYVFYSERDTYNEYIGEFRNNVRRGKGKYMYSNGDEYTGNFRNEMPNGIGRMLYKSGAEYIGEWVNNIKEGRGFYRWPTGELYIGEFKNGKFDGEGLCYSNEGDLVYEGEWKENNVNGKGLFIWDDGKSYEGDFLNGKKHGEGTFYINGESFYQGTWENDEPIIYGMSFEELFSKWDNTK